ncbi:MAG: twin-arginine translocase TatA/TatE family subunit [Deltaproteobacteria bacterium]|nr:twin-arginine translocase TatA/TatE family subunit [Deltaproteobacteria bacterium]MBQ7248503.1 twin-arginine translocase TatA/TatE family subunit [Deltaproteobacteria bacterium]
MFGIGMQELLIILVLVLIVFGAGKLPQVGEALGKGIRNFKAGLREENNQDDDGKKTSAGSSENRD